MHKIVSRTACIVVALAAIAAPALAQEAQPVVDPFALTETLTEHALSAEVVAPGVLNVGQSTQTLTATNSGNSVSGDTIENGDISIATDAFNGFNGIGNFVMNTGNNSNLQGSVSVVVVMTPQ